MGTSLIQRSFAAGEVAPAIYGRADQVKYQTGLSKCRNMIVRRHGGISNRGGLQYITSQNNHAAQGRIWKFVFNAEQSYILLFENQTLRFVRNGALITVSDVAAYIVAATMSAATQANPCVITAAAHGFSDGQSVTITGVVGMTQLNGNTYTVANATVNTFELLGIDSTAYGAYVSGGTINRNYVVADLVVSGGVNYYCIVASTGNVPPNANYWYPMPSGDIYEIPTPYLTEDLSTLQFSQSGDIVTITRHGYDVRALTRTGHTSWTLTVESFTPSISAPATLTVSGAAGTVSVWVATAIKSVTLEESLPSSTAGSSTKPTSGAPRTLTIGAVSGAQEYNVYRSDGNGIYGYVGSAGSTTFIDDGIIPDFSLTPPIVNTPFSGDDDKPAVSGYYGQRQIYGNTVNEPETIKGSRTGNFKNMTISSPQQDDDAVEFTLAGRQVNEIRAIVEIGDLVVLTSGAEWIREGGASDPLTPTSPNLKAQTYNGCAEIAPIVIADNLLYVQARGSIIRDFRFDQTVQGYTGRDLTVFSPHLTEKYTIVHWDYAQIPNSIAWIVRSDGNLLGLTYLREHEIWGWHWHDTDGTFEDVCVIPEGSEDRVYALIKRTIDGQTKRYLERMASRTVTNIAVDAMFMDSFLSYDGRNTTATTMTLTTATDWLVDSELTLTAFPAFFTSGDVGNSIVLTIETDTYTPEDGWETTTETLTITITGYTSTTVVTGTANKDVPAAFQGLTTTNWAKGVDQVSGLDHLEGKTVAIIGDGYVLSNGIDTPATTVSGGQLSDALERPYTVIHVGLPYCSDAQLLDLEVLGQETISDKRKIVNSVTALVESSRGIWAGEPNERGEMDADDLYEYAQRQVEDEYSLIPGLTGKVDIPIKASWNLGGRVHFRQRDPLPLTILAVIPNLEVGG